MVGWCWGSSYPPQCVAFRAPRHHHVPQRKNPRSEVTLLGQIPVTADRSRWWYLLQIQSGTLLISLHRAEFRGSFR